MTEYDMWKVFPRMPKKVTIGDITDLIDEQINKVL